MAQGSGRIYKNSAKADVNNGAIGKSRSGPATSSSAGPSGGNPDTVWYDVPTALRIAGTSYPSSPRPARSWTAADGSPRTTARVACAVLLVARQAAHAFVHAHAASDRRRCQPASFEQRRVALVAQRLPLVGTHPAPAARLHTSPAAAGARPPRSAACAGRTVPTDGRVDLLPRATRCAASATAALADASRGRPGTESPAGSPASPSSAATDRPCSPAPPDRACRLRSACRGSAGNRRSAAACDCARSSEDPGIGGRVRARRAIARTPAGGTSRQRGSIANTSCGAQMHLLRHFAATSAPPPAAGWSPTRAGVALHAVDLPVRRARATTS